MKTFKLFVTCLFVVGTTLLVAQNLPVRGPIPFSTYDSDGNNIITTEEFDSIKAQRITAKASQGKIMRKAGDSPMFIDIDSNIDGKITKEELENFQQTRFMNNKNQKSKGMKKNKGSNW